MRRIKLDIREKLFIRPFPGKLEDLLDVRDYNRRTEPLLQSLAEIKLGVVEKVHPYRTKWYDYIWVGLLMMVMAVPAYLLPYVGTHLLIAGIDIYLIRLIYKDLKRKLRNGKECSMWRTVINNEIIPKLPHVRWIGGDEMAAWRANIDWHFNWLQNLYRPVSPPFRMNGLSPMIPVRSHEEMRAMQQQRMAALNDTMMARAQRDDSLDAIAHALAQSSPTVNPMLFLGGLAGLGLGSLDRGKE